MKFAHWFALRLIRNHSRLLILVIIALSFGLTQRIGTNLLLSSIKSAMISQSKTFLVGDIEIKSSKPLTQPQRESISETIPRNSDVQMSVECLSIAIASETTKNILVSLKGIQSTFPFYGELQLTAYGKPVLTKTAVQTMQLNPEVWVDQSLKITLNLHEGSEIRLGKLLCIVKGFIQSEPGQGIQGFSFGPRVYIGYPQLLASGLTEEGSKVSYLTILKLPSLSTPGTVATKLRKALGITTKSRAWMTPFTPQDGIQITTHFEKAKQWLRLFSDLSNYFSLLSIVLLILSTSAVGTMVKGYVEKNIPQFGVLEVLGANKIQLLRSIGVLLAYLFLLSMGIGATTGLIAYFGIKYWFADSLPLATGWLWMIKPVLMGMLQSAIFTLLFAGIPIYFAWDWTPLEMLNGHCKVTFPFFKKVRLALIAGGIIFVAMWLETHVFISSAIFGAGLTLMGSVVYFLVSVIVNRIPTWSQKWSFSWQFGMNNLYRFRSYIVFAITALTIGLCCLSMMILYKNAIISELELDRHQRFPDLFLVGIYDHQKNDLNQFFYQWASKLQLEPLVKARITQINQIDIKTNPNNDTPRDNLLNREQNLSFRENLSEGESLIKGEWIKGYYQVEGSLEEWFAKTLGVKLGDSITFEIQGVSVEAKITSIRKVRWTTFAPNFFVLISPGALKDAPKEWLGTVSGLSTEAMPKIQAQLSEQFPSVTIIPVKASVDKIKRLLNLIFHSIILLSLLSLVSGILAVLSVLILTFTLRIPDIQVLKILGFQYPAIRMSTVAELVSLTAIAFVLSNGLAIALMKLFISTQTNLTFKISFSTIFLEGVLLISSAGLVAIILSKKLYKTKPNVSA